MATYDSIAELYQESKQLPFRKFIEEYTLFQLLSNLKGQTVLDIACGEGIYARKMKQSGATSVLGVDLSSEMIRLAEEKEQQSPLGNQYLVRDGAALEKLGDFDIVMGSFLLNYARTKAHLTQFCTSIYKNLKPGGRFVGFNDNPSNDPKYYPMYKKYGFVKSAPTPRKLGDPITYTIFNPDKTAFTIDNYYLSQDIYEQVFRETGFKHFTWHRPLVSSEGLEKFGPDYWKEFMEHPPCIGLEAQK